MARPDLPEHLKRLEIPGRVTLLEGNGELPRMEILTPGGSAEIYLHGAQLTHYQKKGDQPLLFLSHCSQFSHSQPIRGGVPFIFPWFGAREGGPMHGFARTTTWELKETLVHADDSISLRFSLPESVDASSLPAHGVDYVVRVGDQVHLDTTVRNLSKDMEFGFELCLHSYFSVHDASKVEITGLKGAHYLDKVDHFARKVETRDAIRIEAETDRIYFDTAGTVEIKDPGLRRIIRIEKQNAASTVVWNPWITKAQQMPDFGNDEYMSMVCVESGNVAGNRLSLAPGASTTMSVKLSSLPLG